MGFSAKLFFGTAGLADVGVTAAGFIALGAGAAAPPVFGVGVLLVPVFSALFALPAAGAAGLAFGVPVGPLEAAGATGLGFGPLLAAA